VTYEVIIAGQAYRVELLRDLNNPQLWLARINSRELHFNAAPAGRDVLSIVLDGRSYEIMRETVSAAEAEAGTSSNIVIGGRRYAAELRDPRTLRSRRAMGAHGQGPKKNPFAHARQSGACARCRRCSGGSRSRRNRCRSHEDAERAKVA
jgi:hypothetical protein